MDRPVASRQRRLATAALWVLTIWSGTDVVSFSRSVSWEIVLGLASGLFIYADPFRRIWPRRRVMIADLPRLRRDLTPEVPNAVPERIRPR
jgi:hypothetical protein